MCRGTHAAFAAFSRQTVGERTDAPPVSRQEEREMWLFESVSENDKFVLPRLSWIIPAVTVGASLIAIALAVMSAAG